LSAVLARPSHGFDFEVLFSLVALARIRNVMGRLKLRILCRLGEELDSLSQNHRLLIVFKFRNLSQNTLIIDLFLFRAFVAITPFQKDFSNFNSVLEALCEFSVHSLLLALPESISFLFEVVFHAFADDLLFRKLADTCLYLVLTQVTHFHGNRLFSLVLLFWDVEG
jgi:hypothetical protein